MPSHEKQKAPAYQWYLKDWRSSRATQRMSFSERGVYREMLDEQWETLTLPDSPEDVADLIATTDAQRAEVLAAWPVVRPKFASVEGHRIQNLRMERGRKERRKFVREKQAAGQHSVARAVRGPNGTFQQHTNSPTNTSTNSTPTSHRPPAPTALQPSSASAFASASASATAEPSARSKRPIFTGQRLTVFEWMLDDCARTLGSFFESFDIHSFFFDLDARAAREDLVIAQRDGGKWLLGEVVAEAQRRGLPIAIVSNSAAPPLGKLSQRMATMVAKSRSGS